jgi:carbon-monoxide dehydrogenase small subunit
MKQPLALRVNGDTHELYIEPHKTLAEVLREDLGLTGTKAVCGQGACGACTVLLNNRPVLSCLTLAVACRDKTITTIEGLKQGAVLHPLQDAFVEHGAIQCGMCTPAMILTAKALLDENPDPSEIEVREAISGNLCRCTGYAKIVDAIVAGAEHNKNQTAKPKDRSLEKGPLLTPETGE